MFHIENKIITTFLLRIVIALILFIPDIAIAQESPNFSNTTDGTVTSEFGPRTHPVTGRPDNHHGIDIANRVGTTIVAPADGTVVDTGFDVDNGNWITLDHGNGWRTTYLHLQTRDIQARDANGNPTRITRGQQIGTMGSTGSATGPHLHYGVYHNGVAQDPRNHTNYPGGVGPGGGGGSSPGGDHPDETFSINGMTFPVIDTTNKSYPSANINYIGILYNGYPIAISILTINYHAIASRAPEKLNLEEIKKFPVIIIPTGGLYGLEASAFFKASLSEYVKSGGTLIVFAQQHGYEFSILPVPQEADGRFKTVTGYGWTEDQSCFTNAVYIDTYHQILSGQGRSTPTLNVDGYFTNYPSNTTVLLRRTANGQPAMISYPYGNGLVIVTSMYSDWAYGHSQASKEEIALVRDMISWAKKPAQLPEIKPSETVSVAVSAVNNTTTDATQIKFSITDPDRNIITEQIVSAPVPAGQTVEVPFSYTSSSASSLGIYHIDYTLLDSTGNTLQPQAETDSGRFAMSSPPANPYKPQDLLYSINTPSEIALIGEDVPYTVTIWNNSDAEKRLRLWKEFSHFWDVGFLEELVVPAHGSISRAYIQNIRDFGSWSLAGATIWAHFFEENGIAVNKPLYVVPSEAPPYVYVGGIGKRLRVTNPSVAISLHTDNTSYRKGETVNIVLNLQNNQSVSYTTAIKVRVSDSSNATIYLQIFDVSLPATGTSTQSLSFALPQTAQIGFYTILAEAYDANNKKIGGDSASFEVPKSQITVVPNLSSAFVAGTNTITFTITNTGKIGVSSGVLDVSFKDPDGIVIYSGSQPFSIGVAQSMEQSVNISIPSLKFGSYALTYTQSDETRTGSPTSVSITNTAAIVFSFDKPSYRIRETAHVTVRLTNTGKFNLDNTTATISVPDAGYTETKNINIGQGQTQPLQYAIPIPEMISAGQHDVNVTLTLPSGSSIAQSARLTIPESALIIGYTGPTTLTAGDIINLTIENTGGVDTTYTTEKLFITDDNGIEIYKGNITGSVMSAEKKTLVAVQIPPQAVNGSVFLNIRIKDSATLKISELYKALTISGLRANLQTRTDKDAYLRTEGITGISSIINRQFGIENGSLRVTVNRVKGAGTGQFTHFLPKEGQTSFNYPSGVAVAPDGPIYVVDSYNHRIQKFNSSGNLVTMWGSYGTGDGQFNYPFGIAVAPDGSVYVADTENGRIQKFDANGNFITKWNGWFRFGFFQFFKYPHGIAVSADGSVYVADTWNRRIVKFDSNGNFITMWGYGYEVFNDPYGVAVGPDGSIYVADTFNHYIQKFDGNGNFIAKWGTQGSSDGQFYYPFGIAVGPDGAVYVSDLVNRIQKFDNNGNFIKKWAGSGSGDGQFNSPWGIAIAPDNAVYVSDFANNRIQRMVEGGIETIFETTISITQSANTAQDYTANIGTLNTSGKLYLDAELKNSLGQIIATSEYPFYIVEGNTILLFNTDKKVYKPGETATITGEIKNLASVSLDNAVLLLNAGANTLINQTVTVPAGSSYPFTITTTAGSEGVVSLIGKVSQNNSTLVEITDSFEVAKPTLTATINAPDVIGKSPFDLTIELKNTGKVDSSMQLEVRSQKSGIGTIVDTQTIILPAGEKKLLQYSQQITANTIYAISLTGDVTQTITKTVVYGEAAQITIGSGGIGQGASIYPEGKIEIPVTITNTGLVDETIDASFRMQDAGNNLIQEQTKTYYLPKGGSITDTLYFDLVKGSYQLSATSSQPSAAAQMSFTVARENDAAMTVVSGQQSVDGLIPVTVNLTNNGYNAVNGSIQLSVVSGQGVVWSGETQVAGLMSQGSSSYTININPAGITPGDYTLTAGFLNNSNQSFAVYSSPFTVHGAIFQITQLPAYSTFTAGTEGSFTFMVKNTGNQEGEMSFTVKAMDVLDQTVVEWLKPWEEKTITFNLLVPGDIEEKDYFANYELKGQGSGVKGQVKYHVAGVNLSLTATLDKQNYNVGDTAHLILQIKDNRAQKTDINLFARVNYAGYESNQPFTMNGSQSITFDIPLSQITGEKLFYGIYHQSGRSIHLNSLYIHKAGDVITITTDKQVYNPGETVSVSLTGNTSGQMTLTWPGNYTETFAFTGSATKSFTLPTTMTAGAYYLSYQMTDTSGQTYTGSHAIDINGIQVKVKEASLDKAKYTATDAMKLNLTIESNQNLSATLKTWVVDPDGSYTQAGGQAILLSSSEPLLTTGSWSLTTASLGIHRLVYGIYTGDLLLSSGSEAFEVGDAVLLGVSTDRADYPNGDETVKVTSSMYGTVSGVLEYLIDGVSSHTESIAINGFVTHTINIYPSTLSPGLHTLKVVLTAGDLSSTKEVNFVYASVVSATIDIDPDTLNKKSGGQWVTCYIELPVGFRVEDIEINSLLLQGAIPAETQPIAIGDYDADGVSDLMVKFDRQRLQSILPTGENVKITLTGRLKDGKNIKGADYIKVIE